MGGKLFRVSNLGNSWFGIIKKVELSIDLGEFEGGSATFGSCRWSCYVCGCNNVVVC